MKAICWFLLASCVVLSQPPALGPERSILLEHDLSSPVNSSVDIATAKAQLDVILSRPEFRQISRQPSAFERWRRAFETWLADRLGHLFKVVAQHPATSQLVFWVAAVAACGFLAFLLFRIFGEDRGSTWPPTVSTVKGEPVPNNWVRQAFLASDRGDFNKGIQCVYWAAVNFLQGSGVLPRAAGLTPRELARKVQRTSTSAELNQLTASLERFWYACLPATVDDFAACIRSLESLGCKVR